MIERESEGIPGTDTTPPQAPSRGIPVAPRATLCQGRSRRPIGRRPGRRSAGPHAEEREPPLLARKDPGLVAVAETWRRAARPQAVLDPKHDCGLRDPRCGDEIQDWPSCYPGQACIQYWDRDR